MTPRRTEILVAGGGIAGLSASCAFAAQGFEVLCVDPVPPVTDRAAQGADLRTTAFLQPALDFFAEAGAWDVLKTRAVSLQTMRIVDAGGREPVARTQKDFRAEEIGEKTFGYNLPNTGIRASLLERIATLPSLDFRPGLAVSELDVDADAARVQLSDGTDVRARLIIAADGRASTVRKALGIGVRRHDFGQTALTFAVTHDQPHDHVSVEVHRRGGPFTLVPLPDYQGRPSSAVVWMEETGRAKALLALKEAEFNCAATRRSARVLGRLKLITVRTSWPIISQLADRFHGQRTALVAEAAHVMPPIGAQGLNTSLQDLHSLLRLAQAAPHSIGAAEMLRRYHAGRFPAVAVRMLGIGVLNQVSMVDSQPLRDARALGLHALHGFAPIRRSLMRLGLGR